MRFPGIELLKWAGLSAMLYDHLAYFSGWALPFAAAIGAFAFPFFSIAMVAALVDAGRDKHSAIASRMFRWGIIAQGAVLLVRDPLPLNVLFTLAAGLLLGGRTERPKGREWFGAIVLVLVCSLSEFSFFGALYIGALFHYFRGGAMWWPVLAAVPLLAFNEGQVVSVVATWVGLVMAESAPALPRLKRVFYPFYVFQYPLLRVLS